MEGRLDGGRVAAVSVHLDTCEECRAIVGAVQPVLAESTDTASAEAIAPKEAPSGLRAPSQVGRYLLRRVIGQGGMGTVYEAFDPELGRTVALKLLRARKQTRARRAGSEGRLLAEAQSMAKLAHANVVAVYDVGSVDGCVYVIMELVKGMSLRHWLASRGRPIRAILDTFVLAGQGLAAAHAAGLVHRDFKPENVFVSRDHRVLVGDFGLAVSSDPDPALRADEGTLAYMAPEQRAGTAVDARSDRYSFALALDQALQCSNGKLGAWL
jgi:eukaryotic-like serine/threonine-protein kinase